MRASARPAVTGPAAAGFVEVSPCPGRPGLRTLRPPAVTGRPPQITCAVPPLPSTRSVCSPARFSAGPGPGGGPRGRRRAPRRAARAAGLPTRHEPDPAGSESHHRSRRIASRVLSRQNADWDGHGERLLPAPAACRAFWTAHPARFRGHRKADAADPLQGQVRSARNTLGPQLDTRRHLLPRGQQDGQPLTPRFAAAPPPPRLIRSNEPGRGGGAGALQRCFRMPQACPRSGAGSRPGRGVPPSGGRGLAA